MTIINIHPQVIDGSRSYRVCLLGRLTDAPCRDELGMSFAVLIPAEPEPRAPDTGRKEG